MSNLRRYYATGQTYFVTIVTHKRQPLLTANHQLLRTSLDESTVEYGAKLIAWVILPEHCHLIIEPVGNDLSEIMRKTKMRFAARLRSLLNRRDGRIWQNRFWDHIIRDQDDLNRHIDYIHYNPVKHSMIQNPFAYELSSASEFLKSGFYQPDWGTKETLSFEGEFGE